MSNDWTYITLEVEMAKFLEWKKVENSQDKSPGKSQRQLFPHQQLWWKN